VRRRRLVVAMQSAILLPHARVLVVSRSETDFVRCSDPAPAPLPTPQLRSHVLRFARGRRVHSVKGPFS